jgi:hypothetical protein
MNWKAFFGLFFYKHINKMSGGDNVIRVRGSSTPGRVINISKKVFETFESIELHGVGPAIATATIAANRLASLGYGAIKSIKTEIVTDLGKAAKIVLTLTRSDRFFELDAEFKKTVAERQEQEETKE